ncbi:MAG: hypothetical protein JSS24_11485, partial [Proteobacteria bacterium]|nr:hypothetical protein [Pseudomonadota bacterium]
MKRRILIVTVLVFALFVALPAAAVYFVLYTQSGLEFALAQLPRLDDIVRIRAEGVSGNLAGGVRLARVEIEQERVGIRVDNLEFRLVPHALLLQTLQVEDAAIDAARVEVRNPAHPSTSNTPLKFLPSFLRITTRAARLRSATVVLPNHYE